MTRIVTRMFSRSRRELALWGARVRWPRARFGSGCDVRRGLTIVMRPGAVLRFGERCVLDRHLTIECEGELLVGARTVFGHHCTVGAKESVQIGADCLIAEMVSIRDSDHITAAHNVPYREQGHVTSPVVVGNNVWLGSRVIVAKGVEIGDDAVVGGGAVVTRSIPGGALAVGVPARVIREDVSGGVDARPSGDGRSG
jgi:acetyltransferase-like isoleucine patch superfamily enzyme